MHKLQKWHPFRFKLQTLTLFSCLFSLLSHINCVRLFLAFLFLFSRIVCCTLKLKCGALSARYVQWLGHWESYPFVSMCIVEWFERNVKQCHVGGKKCITIVTCLHFYGFCAPSDIVISILSLNDLLPHSRKQKSLFFLILLIFSMLWRKAFSHGIDGIDSVDSKCRANILSIYIVSKYASLLCMRYKETTFITIVSRQSVLCLKLYEKKIVNIQTSKQMPIQRYKRYRHFLVLHI